ncbi:hypothetical protein FDH86_gp016 [Arthrobacter phage Tank]|uniref:DUF1360 domain-containing protein n=2 Tax=Tankvirus tank TaxID=1982567 RepID=A0A0U4IYF9_9CAUD|nr:hypothetical protein FDH86_gp016 [Arthrobacter phage Tank]ALY10551.1 hypothetical protein TANK_16 [Arthrobacter phage Tank]ALY10896.1 hypothetical protein WILDE_16 [Arthrobacter phage Wilde]
MVEIVLWIIAFIVGSLSAGRITRLLTQDSFPPIAWLRIKWDDKTDGSSWNILFHCHWCMSMWVTIPIGLWAWLSNLHPSWWVFNAIMAASYVAPMIVERDEKE